ncbi:hypothetical protein [Chitinophaga nivalis]|uniref:Galactose oxidase n=1 Tax=Chitinophaga nivalis TaxID=2991709 RepID=A0ABT3IIC7_9BACT|nr:hypothetical protein [Chitinophaga nivalis]MCW3466616.1 hypothetical protein [Chitinophaga nivalis]MCW3483693.1 hypothetical protein [Chitinophaga nivalis]
MKKSIPQNILLLIGLAVVVLSCNKEDKYLPASKHTTDHISEKKGSQFEGRDWSGKIHTIIVTNEVHGRNNQVAVTVPDEYILVGGGGLVTPKFALPGAFLTGAYPDKALRTWHVSSKEHLLPFQHTLIGYAIGLKIDGLSKEELRKYIRIDSSRENKNHNPETPEAVAAIPKGYVVIGGGVRIDWSGAGTLLTKSIPGNADWGAAGHKNIESSNAHATVFSISIKSDIPTWGKLEVIRDYAINKPGPDFGGYRTVKLVKRKGWALTAVGGDALLTDKERGRYLTGIVPKAEPDESGEESSIVISKDNINYREAGNVAAYNVIIRKQP